MLVSKKAESTSFLWTVWWTADIKMSKKACFMHHAVIRQGKHQGNK